MLMPVEGEVFRYALNTGIRDFKAQPQREMIGKGQLPD
jgi:hypothetical protein